MRRKIKKSVQIFLIYAICFIPGFAYAGCIAGNYVGNDYQAIIGDVQIDATAVVNTSTDINTGCNLSIATPIIDDLGNVVSYGSMNIFSGAICLIQVTVSRVMFDIYCSLVDEFKNIVGLLVILYLCFYGVQVALSSQKGKIIGQDGAAQRLITVLLIYTLATNADLFYFWVYKTAMVFLHSFSAMIASIEPIREYSVVDGVLTVTESVSGNLFNNIDKIFEVVVGTEFAVGLLTVAAGLLTAWFPFGAFFSIMILLGVVTMLWAFMTIFTNYLGAILKLSFVMMFAPIFLSFALFEQTKQIFIGWLAAIISYVLQACLVLAFVFVIAKAQQITPMLTYIKETSHYNPEKKWTLSPFSMITFTLRTPGFDVVDNPMKCTNTKASEADIATQEEDPPIDVSAVAASGRVCAKILMGECKDDPDNPTACTHPDYFKIFKMIASFSIAILLINALTAAFLSFRSQVGASALAEKLSTFSNTIGTPIITGAPMDASQRAGGSSETILETSSAGKIYGMVGLMRDTGRLVNNVARGSGSVLAKGYRNVANNKNMSFKNWQNKKSDGNDNNSGAGGGGRGGGTGGGGGGGSAGGGGAGGGGGGDYNSGAGFTGGTSSGNYNFGRSRDAVNTTVATHNVLDGSSSSKLSKTDKITGNKPTDTTSK